GMPPTETCMSCHSQIRLDSALLAPVRSSWETGEPIEWNRVNDVPDHVYFNHSIHISKGVGCESCHGRTDRQTVAVKANAMYMTFCLDCHENPAKYLRPKDQVYAMGYTPAGDQQAIGAQLVEEYNVRPPSVLTNCSICHR
ncbi:MAG: cytochrome C, partial [Chloroflexi bacterium]